MQEAAAAIKTGADALGLVARMPTGPEPIPDHLIREIAAAAPPPVATFLLTSLSEPHQLVEHVRMTGVSAVQLVDDRVGREVWQALRQQTPATPILQVIHVRDAGSAYIFDPYYNEVYTITRSPDAAVISKPVWFAEPNGAVRHVATVSTTFRDGEFSEPSLDIMQAGKNKPKPMWEVGKMKRMGDMIREALARLRKESIAADDGANKPLGQRGDL